MDSLSIHRATGVKVLVTEPRVDVIGRKYCVTKIIVSKEDGTSIGIDIFGNGHPEHEEVDTALEVYPFVELERPK